MISVGSFCSRLEREVGPRGRIPRYLHSGGREGGYLHSGDGGYQGKDTNTVEEDREDTRMPTQSVEGTLC